MPESRATLRFGSGLPSSRHTAAGLVRMFVDRAKRLTNYENRTKLCDIGYDLEKCAISMDNYFDDKMKVGGSYRYHPFQVSRELITAYENLATELQSHVQQMLDEGDELVALQDAYGRFMSASQNVGVDQLREDMGKLGSLLVNLARHQNPYQPSINARKLPQTKPNNLSSSKPTHHVPLNQMYSENEDTREATMDSPSRSPKKVRLNDPSNRTTLTVLNLCSDSDEEDSIEQSQHAGLRNDLPSESLERRGHRHGIPMPARLANAPLPQPRGRCKKGTRRPSQKRSMLSNDRAFDRGKVKSDERSHPTNAQITSDDPAEAPIYLASAILRAVGRHPNLPPLNHAMKGMLSSQALGKCKPTHTAQGRELAEAQNQIAREAVRWWQARGEFLDCESN